MTRLPDPSWKSGPPDPPRWTVHEHEFEYAEADVEVMDGYVYVHQSCLVDDGHPYDPQKCEANRTITYKVSEVEQGHYDSLSGEWIGQAVSPLGPHADVHLTVVRKAEEKIREDPFAYDILEEGDFEVSVETLGSKFFVLFEHDGTDVREW